MIQSSSRQGGRMFSAFIPKEEKFFDLLENAASNAHKAASAFQELMHKWAQGSELFKKVRDIETEGDLLTHEIIDKLNRTFVTPIDREDIHNLAGQIDDVCDILQALSDRMQLYNLESRMPEKMLKMADLLEESATSMEAAVKEFHNFRRDRRVHDHCIEIKRIENEADELLKHALAELFKSTDPMSVIKWKEIYETIEDAHDKLSHIANTLEGIIVKNA
jgi:predicted phosphate transport protein (TIGR00153 family)